MPIDWYTGQKLQDLLKKNINCIGRFQKKTVKNIKNNYLICKNKIKINLSIQIIILQITFLGNLILVRDMAYFKIY